VFQCIAQLPSTSHEFPDKGKMGVVKPIGPVTPDLSDLPPVDFFTCARQKSVFYNIIRIYILWKKREILVNLTFKMSMVNIGAILYLSITIGNIALNMQ